MRWSGHQSVLLFVRWCNRERERDARLWSSRENLLLLSFFSSCRPFISSLVHRLLILFSSSFPLISASRSLDVGISSSLIHSSHRIPFFFSGVRRFFLHWISSSDPFVCRRKRRRDWDDDGMRDKRELSLYHHLVFSGVTTFFFVIQRKKRLTTTREGEEGDPILLLHIYIYCFQENDVRQKDTTDERKRRPFFSRKEITRRIKVWGVPPSSI